MTVATDESQKHTQSKGGAHGHSHTTTDRASCTQTNITCTEKWSIEQAHAMEMLSIDKTFIGEVVQRCQRTAGNYAALFLNDEEAGHTNRFYWAGLAVFAAKGVVDGVLYARLSSWLDTYGYLGLDIAQIPATTYYYLLKGNTWLFLDVMPWLTYYKHYGYDKFYPCAEARNSNTYCDSIRKKVQHLPWGDGAKQDSRCE